MNTHCTMHTAKTTGSHCHRCDYCGDIWSHSCDAAGSKEDHTCLHCGREQWWKYFEDRPDFPLDEEARKKLNRQREEKGVIWPWDADQAAAESQARKLGAGRRSA